MKKMDEMIKNLKCGLMDVFDNSYTLMSGFSATILGYFLPVKNIVHLLILFFILDVVFGYWAARKLRNERFKVDIIWTKTMPRMLISIVVILGAFMWDTTFGQDLVCTYKLIGWFISGVLLASIAENGYNITKWSVFPKIGGIFRSRVQDTTGMDISDNKKEDGAANN